MHSINFYLSSYLCRIKSVEETDHNFHARYSTKTKMYRYCIYIGRQLSVFDINRCWFIHESMNIDIDLVKKQANMLVGKHNFSSFCHAKAVQSQPVRVIDKIEIYKYGENKFHLDFYGKSFLHQQVRIMVGTLVDIGRGHIKKDISYILDSKDRQEAGQTAPGCGLYLMKIDY